MHSLYPDLPHWSDIDAWFWLMLAIVGLAVISPAVARWIEARRGSWRVQAAHRRLVVDFGAMEDKEKR